MMNKGGTTLFRHEIGYVLGQMQARAAVPHLLTVLRDVDDDPIVRHEVRARVVARAGMHRRIRCSCGA
jgi:HEAT repeat protein